MTAEPTQVTLRLGNINLEAFRLEDSSYAAPGLFKLNHTSIYRYGECWYWLNDNGIPDLENCRIPSDGGDAFLVFEGNKLCYLYVNPVNQARQLCVPIPCDLPSVIAFCDIGKLVSNKAISSLKSSLDLCWRPRDLVHRPTYSRTLLKDTAQSLPKVEVGATVVKKKKSSSVPKRPSSTFNTRIPGMPIGCDGFIYLVKLDAHLKLGFTRNLNTRLKSFETTSIRVELIKSIPGSLQDEQYLHSILDSKARELYDFKDEHRIKQEMVRVSHVTSVRVR
jgi:hypothetical protein